MPRRAATTIGADAARLLEAGGEGRVVAVFARSLYLEIGGGLVCVGPADFGPGPMHLLVDADEGDAATAGIAIGDAGAVRGSVLDVAGVGFDIAGLVPWRAPPPPPFSAATLARGLDRLASAVAERTPAGIGVLVADLCRGTAPSPDRLDRMLAPAAAPIAALVAWARAGGRGAVPDVARLVGLGPGLTPSGDDFLAGFLVALRRLGHADAADALASVVLPFAATATNTIAAAHLAHAAAGEAAARLVDVLDRIAVGDVGADLLGRVETIGHTSGWDTLAGLTGAAAAVVGRGLEPPPTT